MSKNRWVLPRSKRDLKLIPKIIAVFSGACLNQQWSGERGMQLTIEEALEKAELKRVGDRRDQRGSGARTYKAQCKALGLIFIQESSGRFMLTLAGEAILEGKSPVKVITNQLMKFQYPSAYSLGKRVDVNPQFKIRPFRFLLKLLADDRIKELSQEEIAKIVVTEASHENNAGYERIVSRILEFRERGDACLPENFVEKHNLNPNNPMDNLIDTANTFINYLNYTQLIDRESARGANKEKSTIRIRDDRREDVLEILSSDPPFIDRPENEEFFQRKYGIDPWHNKDTRNLSRTVTITQQVLTENLIKQAYLALAAKRPVYNINPEVVNEVAESTGVDCKVVEKHLLKNYPHGSIGVFMAEYYEMAFKHREEATEFEKATAELFRYVFGFDTKHVGPQGLTPDVLVISDSEGYQAILDNKAYSKYTINNDHRNRMIHNYIADLSRYSDSDKELAFFSYIAGGFGSTFDKQLREIIEETGINGCGISVTNMIKLVENYSEKGYTHKNLRDIFSVNRQVLLSDFS